MLHAAFAPVLQAVTFPRAEDSRHLFSHVVPLWSELNGALRWGPNPVSGSPVSPAGRQPSANQSSGDHF